MKENATDFGKSGLAQKTHQYVGGTSQTYPSHYFVSNLCWTMSNTQPEDKDIASLVAAVTPAETDDWPLQTTFKTKIHEASYMYEVRNF